MLNLKVTDFEITMKNVWTRRMASWRGRESRAQTVIEQTILNFPNPQGILIWI